MMKIDTATLGILKNFSNINPSLLFKEGNLLRTMSPNMNILSEAKLKQSFEKSFAIYDLSKFLSAMSLFDKPVIKFNDENYATITSEDDSRFINYVFADPNHLKGIAKDSNPKIGTIITSFHLRKQSLADATKALAIFSLPVLAIVGDGEKLSLQAVDPKKSGSYYYEVIGDTDKTFKAYIKSENIKIIPNDYTLEVGKNGAVHLFNDDIEYWISLEKESAM